MTKTRTGSDIEDILKLMETYRVDEIIMADGTMIKKSIHFPLSMTTSEADKPTGEPRPKVTADEELDHELFGVTNV